MFFEEGGVGRYDLLIVDEEYGFNADPIGRSFVLQACFVRRAEWITRAVDVILRDNWCPPPFFFCC